MKTLKLSACAFTVLLACGCVSNAADTATPAPTELTGIYKATFMGGSVAWNIESDGTGVACEERTSMNTNAKLRDMVINGDTAYDVYEYKITGVTDTGFVANGIVNLDFKQINKMPAACR